jgi:hypothetical protein
MPERLIVYEVVGVDLVECRTVQARVLVHPTIAGQADDRLFR